MRWQEEVLLLQEEQRRTIVSLEKYAQVWDSRAKDFQRDIECPILAQGMQAYAMEQAAGRRSLARKFLSIWRAKRPQDASRQLTAQTAGKSTAAAVASSAIGSTRSVDATAGGVATAGSDVSTPTFTCSVDAPSLLQKTVAQQADGHPMGAGESTVVAPTVPRDGPVPLSRSTDHNPFGGGAPTHMERTEQDSGLAPRGADAADTRLLNVYDTRMVDQDDGVGGLDLVPIAEDVGREGETDADGVGLQRGFIVDDSDDE